MTYGPIDFLAIEFKGNKFSGEIMPALLELVANGTIRIIDLVIVTKDENGRATSRELQQLDEETLRVFDPLKAEITGLISMKDIAMIEREIESNSTAGVLLYENLWAVKFKEAVVKANGRLLMQERIPHEIIEEALEIPA